MRIYIPASPADLGRDEISPRPVHAVTHDLRAALVDEDDESLEYHAFALAAEDSLDRGRDRHAIACRVVISAEVDDAVTDPADDPLDPSLVTLRAPVPFSAAVALHVDDSSAYAAVERAIESGDATELDDIDLLWFDISEREAVYQTLVSVTPEM